MDSPVLNYPQALYKQSYSLYSVDYDREDIQLKIRSGMPWYLRGQDNMRPGMLDLECNILLKIVLAIRELTHGLGFQSEIVDYNQHLNTALKFSAPRINPGYQSPVVNAPFNSKVRTFACSVFDSLLYGSGSLGELAHTISKFEFQPTKKYASESARYEDFAANLQADQVMRKAGVDLYQMKNTEPISAVLGDGSSLKVQTIRQDMNPISFVDRPLYNGPEFIMTREYWAGTTLDAVMKKLKVNSIFGPLTLQLLEDMGYATVNNPQMLELEPIF